MRTKVHLSKFVFVRSSSRREFRDSRELCNGTACGRRCHLRLSGARAASLEFVAVYLVFQSRCCTPEKFLAGLANVGFDVGQVPMSPSLLQRYVACFKTILNTRQVLSHPLR